MNTAYSSYKNWKKWESTRFGECDYVSANYFKNELRPLNLAKGAHVLEIGFGNGSFLFFAKQEGYTVEGIELINELTVAANKAGYQTYADIEECVIKSGKKYDLIMALDVFEHLTVDQLVLLFKNCSSLLNKEGYIVARFPNGDSAMSLPYQNGDLTHITHIGQGKMEQLASMCSLEIVAWKAPARMYPNSRVKKIFKIVKDGIRFVTWSLYSLIIFNDFKKPSSPNVVVVLKNI